ncbi:hypothetical protein EPUS_02171 [Endocarpon pusillum Z07020]|uniref:Amidase domain-containing protein n=1 Tax=Endocarpon pusillum (strain Z07020 / HMAS-L-300199) TaxID=1263415 RepID=U1HST7_ENDPU|nr:uncharacterized protein EPUS_02171 [Endocarpon pusillum Z07020]ERF72284.1 hypothetical protein EPUS_02171 [Endocarpon pusillum Z07020]
MATADWVDYHSPFNARGDGYQDPSSSSAGAGASMGTYPWLDIAVGSDTGGSIRGPSQTQGLFGNRPTHDAVELTGVMPLSPVLDTAGFLTRDPELWATAQEVLYGPLPAYDAYPSRILTYNFPTNASSAASGLALDFLAKLQSFLSANVSSVNLTSQWASSGPANSTSSLTSLLNVTYAIIVSKQQTRLVRDPFYVDYAAVHDGRRPFIDPSPLVRWTYADSQPDSALDEALHNKTLFMDWFNSNVLVPDPVTCSNAFMIYLAGTGMSNARNQISQVHFRSQRHPRLPPTVPFGFNSGRISVFAEVPDSVFPIGQASYFSNITQHEEYLPVAIDILAAKGCDAIIARLANDLVAAGILNVTQAGQTIYGGDVLYKREVDEQ